MEEETLSMVVVAGKAVSALLNPRPVVLVTTCSREGRPNVLPVAWQTPLSHEPALVGISIAASRFSHRLIEETGQFVINVVDDTFAEAVALCGNCSGESVDKFAAAQIRLLPAHSVTPPLITGALAHIECSVVKRVEVGTHTFFIGAVEYAEVNQASFNGCWQPGSGDVLLCVQRDRYTTLRPAEGGQGQVRPDGRD